MMIGSLPAVGSAAQVVGVLLNHRSAWDHWAPHMNQDPYKAAPKAPILYLKPSNTWTASGAKVALPSSSPRAVMGACLGVVIGERTTRVSASEALTCVAGYCLVLDVSLQQTAIYRPPLKFNARDGFCPMGPHIVPVQQLPKPESLQLHVQVAQHAPVTIDMDWIRNIPRLITDITEFMSLNAGDVLLTGVAHSCPLASVGDTVRVWSSEVALGELTAHMVEESV
jgi:5-oxopent-3-ene-1,2,5-tricarboxylate decarboxylase / 2-hydroxyhepta-2,4-diene-1,7-dioate isomerase